MYTPDDQDQVTVLIDAPKPASSSTDPILMAQEDILLLSYYLQDNGGASFGADEVAMLTFHGVLSHMFGLPNKSVLSGHPLASRGLEPFGVYTVTNSSWLRALEQVHSVHERHDPKIFMRLKNHYIFTFHDSTFECIAEGFKYDLHEIHIAQVRPRMLAVIEEMD